MYLAKEEGGDNVLKKIYALVPALVFCYTATLFIAASTGYDPWVDYDARTHKR